MGIITRLSSSQSSRKSGTRMYAGARLNRLTAGWNPLTGSADSELWSSLTNLRNRSRQLVRDNAYAKRAKLIVVNNVVGSGIAMEPQVRTGNKLNERVNDAIEEAYNDWSRAENCHTGGTLGFADFERQVFGQIFEAGECLIRKYYTKFGSSAVPLGLELVEAERLADDLITPVGAITSNYYRMGVERDEFGRALGFWVRKYHPGEFRYASGADDPNQLYRVPAEQMFHLYVCDRWPQTRGEPWLHAAMRRLNDMDGYSEAEIVRARIAACRVGIIQSPDEAALPNDQTDQNLQPQFDLEPGEVRRLAPGETWTESPATSPNPNADPFMRLMLREVAAGVGPSYESLSRDYSQSNYSSSRLALLDDRDLWRVFQQFFIRSFREPLYREWLRQAVLARAIPAIPVSDYVAQQSMYEAVSFKPRGWSWINPKDEVDAYKEARRSGFMSTGMIIAATGGGVDRDDVWSEIDAENQDAKDKGLIFDTDTALVDDKGKAQGITGGVAPVWDSSGQTIAPTAPGAKPSQEPEGDPKATDTQGDDESQETDLAARSLTLVRSERTLVERIAVAVEAAIVRALQEAPNQSVVHNYISPQPVHINTPDVKVDIAPAQVIVNMPEQPINVTSPDVKVDIAPAEVNVHMPEQPIHIAPADVHVNTPDVHVEVAAPQVHVESPPINVTTPDIHVDVAAPNVNIEAPKHVEFSEAEIIERDGNHLAKVVRTNKGDFELTRDENGDQKMVRRKTA